MQQNRDGEQKWFKRFGHFSLIVLFLSTLVNAGSFEDFKRTQNSSFNSFRDERDAEFNNYLKAQWKEYNAQYSKPMYEKPKPKSITPTVQKHIKSIGPRVNIKITKPYVKKDTNLTKPSHKKPKIVVKVKQDPKDINMLFFGQELGFNYDEKIKSAQFYPQNQTGILNFFNVLASSDYEDLVREIEESVKKLGLNDWGVYMLVHQISSQIYSNEDSQKLLSWFLFNKLGYAVKIGLEEKHVVLMHYSKKIIYSTPRYSFNGKKFYVISRYAKRGSTKRVYTYKQNYPGATKALDLSLNKLPKFRADLEHKTLSFKQFGKEYKTSFSYDKNLIDFMATYPQADYDTYFNAPMSEETYAEIAQDIKKYIDGKKASVGINFVLNFVQKAFAYERDNTQFGREKVMFAAETLFYDKSDCEDRAILFSYLVKNLFGISVVGVEYQNHMATALYIPMSGDSVYFQGRRYVVADPTYINANVGMCMPKFRAKLPKKFIYIKQR